MCRRFKVRRLEVFGSAATDRFDPQRSDLDFLVEYQPLAFGEYADCYFGLLAGLEDLFGRPIDLVQPEAIRNPYFLRGIQGTRTLVYEHRDEEVPV
ncbi:MAG TPA: nucleotidyltransferase domain-containing protein [Phycisphaerae bacterium]|nr:nucleotidyltransferase domain-containing protein [Phycisphaerae bacterium]